jgi:glycosyltransferase involved in cell wall biosynthesis
MNILFIHQNFPSQFVHLATHLAQKKQNKVVALTMSQQGAIAGVTLRPYTLLRPAAPETHPLLKDQEAKILLAEACAAAALQLKHEGFVPDVIIAHPGWGEALFMKDVFPQARIIVYCEFYYNLEGQDVGFDPEIPPLNFQQRCRLRLKNSTNLLSMEIADAAISPTQWQRSTYPLWAQEKISVIHDGIDIERLKFNPKARLNIAPNQHHAALNFKPGDEVLSYVARSLEPVRGFQILMRALPKILSQRPNAHVLLVGGDGLSYGHGAPNSLSWREHLMAEVGGALDMRRVHFLGKVPYAAYLDLLSVSKLHSYWTTPFVLSWSFLEAALSGVPVLASGTQPVNEFAASLGVDTFDFFDHDTFSEKASQHLQAEAGLRHRVECPEFHVEYCLKQQVKLINSI